MKSALTVIALWLIGIGSAPARGASVFLSVQGREQAGEVMYRDDGALGQAVGGLASGPSHLPGSIDVSERRVAGGLDDQGSLPATNTPPVSTTSVTAAVFTTTPVDMPFQGFARFTTPRGGLRGLVFDPTIEVAEVLEPRSYILLAESVVCLLACLPRRTGNVQGGRACEWD